jgi:hypothetical protein
VRREARVALPPSDSIELERIGTEIGKLEQLCNELELGLREREWARMVKAMRETRRVLHALQNAMAELKSLRTTEFDSTLFARLQRVYAVHQDQMKRVQTVHDEAGARLRTISKWKSYARSIGGSKIEQQPSAQLFQDLR